MKIYGAQKYLLNNIECHIVAIIFLSIQLNTLPFWCQSLNTFCKQINIHKKISRLTFICVALSKHVYLKFFMRKMPKYNNKERSHKKTKAQTLCVEWGYTV